MSRQRHSRGSVAVEFALVMPLFMMIVAMIVAFGQAMWARSQMLNFITAAGRQCTLQLPVNRSQIESCLSNRWSAFSQSRLVGSCTLGNLKWDYYRDNVARSDVYQPNVYMLALKLSCKMGNIPFAGILQGGAQNGFNVSVDASFPYLPNNGNGLIPSSGP